mgnify:CR=1 FL=1
MATTETKTDDVTSKDLVFDPKTGDYVPKTMSAELYKQMKEDERRRATIAGTAGVIGEAAQIGIGASVFGDPSIKAAQDEKARLQAEISKDPNYLTEQQKADYVAASIAPAERQAGAARRKVSQIAATTGKFDAGTLLRSMDKAIPEITQATLVAKSELAAQDVAAEQIKYEQDKANRSRVASIDQMMLNLRNEFIRQPLHKFIGSAGKLAGTMMAYETTPTIDKQVERLRAAEVPDEEIAEFVELYRRKPRKGRKAADEILAKLKGKTPDTQEVEEEAKPVPAMSWKDTSTGKYAGVEYRLGEDEKIRYNSPDTGKEIVVEPGTEAYKAIMGIRPEPAIPEAPMTTEERREQASAAVDKKELKAQIGQTMKDQFGDTDTEESPTGGNPEARAALQAEQEAEELKKTEQAAQQTALETYQESLLRNPMVHGSLFTKKEDDGYAYGYKDGVWTVYQNKPPYFKPIMKSGTNEPITFTIEEVQNSKNPSVRELYDLGVAKGLIGETTAN